jgi:integrase
MCSRPQGTRSLQSLGAAVTVMITMGLRPGEVLGLGWGHIDLDTSRLDVRRSLKREPGGLRLGDVKTKNSRRSLLMPRLVVERLGAHRHVQRKERLAASEWHDLDLVFASNRGTLIDPRNFRRHFDKLTEQAGIGKWTPNELRHSAVSLLSAAGVPVEEIADVVGHDGARMTTGVYRHVLAPVVNSAAAPMDDLFH